MKITASQLRRIISEEVSTALAEAPKKPMKHWQVTDFDTGRTREYVIGTVQAPNEDGAVAAAEAKFKDWDGDYGKVKQVSASTAASLEAKMAGDRAAARASSARDTAFRSQVSKTAAASTAGMKLWLAVAMGWDPNTEDVLGALNAPDEATARSMATKKWGADFTDNYGKVRRTNKAELLRLAKAGDL